MRSGSRSKYGHGPPGSGGLWYWRRIERVQRIGSHLKYFFAVVETVPIGIRGEGVDSDCHLVGVEEFIPIHIGNRSH